MSNCEEVIKENSNQKNNQSEANNVKKFDAVSADITTVNFEKKNAVNNLENKNPDDFKSNNENCIIAESNDIIKKTTDNSIVDMLAFIFYFLLI